MGYKGYGFEKGDEIEIRFDYAERKWGFTLTCTETRTTSGDKIESRWAVQDNISRNSFPSNYKLILQVDPANDSSNIYFIMYVSHIWSIEDIGADTQHGEDYRKQVAELMKGEILPSMTVDGESFNFELAPVGVSYTVNFSQEGFNPKDPRHVHWALAIGLIKTLTIDTGRRKGWCDRLKNEAGLDYSDLLIPKTPEPTKKPKPTKPNPKQGQLYSYLDSSGLLFLPHLPPAFWNALRTKGFVFLAGLTGTGKTKLAVEVGRALSEKLDKDEEHYKFISVRPDWTDKTELLGWVDPLKGTYRKGLLLDFLLRAIDNYLRAIDDYATNDEGTQPFFLILDEMNLAHIEYYFADFLSVLESGRTKQGETPKFSHEQDPYWENYDWAANPGWTYETIKLHTDDGITDIPREIPLPPNLYIIGTLNTDETTKSLSPKVLDRGFVLEFGEVDMENYPPSTSGEKKPSSELIEGMFGELRNPLKPEKSNEKACFLSHVGNKNLVNPKTANFVWAGGKLPEKKEDRKTEKMTDYGKHLYNLKDLLQPHDLHFGYRIIDEIALFVLAAEQSKIAKLDENEAFDLAVCSKVLPKFYGTRARLEKPLWKVVGWAVDGDSETWKKAYDDKLNSVKSEFVEKAIALDEAGLLEDFADNNKGASSTPGASSGQGESASETPGGGDQTAENKVNFTYPHTALKALRMLRRLYEEGFASYL